MKNGGFVILLLGLFVPSVGFASAQWPNEPPGATPLLDFAFSSMQGNGLIFAGGNANLANEGTTSFVRYHYPIGFTGGSGAAKHYAFLPQLREVFYGYWFRHSNPWQGHISNINKLSFIVTGNFSNENIITMHGAGSGPFKIVTCVGGPGVDNTHIPGAGNAGEVRNIYIGTTVSVGVWHRMEAYIKYSTTATSRDGIYRLWLDGNLVLNLTTVNWNQDGLSEFQFSPTWGGVGDTKTQNDYLDFDHVYISQPHGDGGFVPPLSITSAALPSARSGAPYSTTLSATGGKSPYSWTITTGSLLPGLYLNKSTGVISGTPSTGGRCDFIVKVLDSSVPAKEATKSLYIVASGSASVAASEGIGVDGFQVRTSSGKVRFVFPEHRGGYELGIFDLYGNKVFQKVGCSRSDWDFEAKLNSGIYVARLIQGQKKSVARFSIVDARLK